MSILKLLKMILIWSWSSIVMIVTIKDTSLKQTIQGMLKWTEQQRGKRLQKESHQQRRKIYSCNKKGLIPKEHHAFFSSHTVTTSGGKKDHTDSNNVSDKEEDESSDAQ